MSTKIKSKGQLKADPQSFIMHKLNEIHNSLNVLHDSQFESNEVTSKLESINATVGQLTHSQDQQNEFNSKVLATIKNLKYTVSTQNNVLTNVLSEHIVGLRMSFKAHFEAPKYAELFPLKSDSDMLGLENMINDENRSEIVSSIRSMIGTKGLQRGLSKIFASDVILNYNVNGIQGKKRLMDYKKVINTLFLATSSEGCSQFEFVIAMRKALKAAKNKIFKTRYLNKNSEKENLFNNMENLFNE